MKQYALMYSRRYCSRGILWFCQGKRRQDLNAVDLIL